MVAATDVVIVIAVVVVVRRRRRRCRCPHRRLPPRPLLSHRDRRVTPGRADAAAAIRQGEEATVDGAATRIRPAATIRPDPLMSRRWTHRRRREKSEERDGREEERMGSGTAGGWRGSDAAGEEEEERRRGRGGAQREGGGGSRWGRKEWEG